MNEQLEIFERKKVWSRWRKFESWKNIHKKIFSLKKIRFSLKFSICANCVEKFVQSSNIKDFSFFLKKKKKFLWRIFNFITFSFSLWIINIFELTKKYLQDLHFYHTASKTQKHAIFITFCLCNPIVYSSKAFKKRKRKIFLRCIERVFDS